METAQKEKQNYSNELEEKLRTFKLHLQEIQSLSVVQGIASWDIETSMPKKGSEFRAWIVSLLAKQCHEKLTSEITKNSLEYLRSERTFNSLNKIDKAIVREIGRTFDKEVKIPTKIIQELSELTSKSHVVWAEAKEKNDTSKFLPLLEKIFSLKKEIASYIGYEKSPYDALLDSYEEGMTTEHLNILFSNLKNELIPFIKKIKDLNIKNDFEFLKKKYNSKKQLELSENLLKYIGYDFERGRLDESNHPFTIGLGPDDVRLTTRISEDNLLSNIGSTIHEGGHALYELGIDPSLAKTPIGSGASLGIHESQSRLYETVIGQGMPFWKGFFPNLQKHFPEELKDVSLEEIYKAINHVQPSFIRVDSDEVTYNLHIVIRFEIERDIIEGKIQVKDIREIWNEKMKEYLGIIPRTNSEGFLQDVHWSWGAIGYFPTYTIGNLTAAQIYNAIKKQIPDIEIQTENGNLVTIKDWLNKNIHHCGATETPKEIILRATGEELNSKYFINYIKEKYTSLYNL